MAKTSDGYYYFSGPNNEYLYYMDKDSLKSTVLCNKPNCLHSNERDAEKVTDCNAYFLGANSCLIYYDKSRESKKNPEKIYEFDGIYAGIKQISAYGNYIYFTCGSYADSSLKKYSGTLMTFCINDLSIQEISRNVGCFFINGSSIVYYWTDKQIYICDMNGKNKRTLDLIGSVADFDKNYIYTDTLYNKMTDNVNKIRREIYVYTSDGKLIASCDIDDMGADLPYGGDSEYFFIPDDNSKSNQYGTIRSMWALKKSELSSGKAIFTKIFEFIPKVQFPGVITHE